MHMKFFLDIYYIKRILKQYKCKKNREQYLNRIFAKNASIILIQCLPVDIKTMEDHD